MVGTANEENAVARSGLEPVDRLEQAQRRDLHEVVERLAAALVAARELAGERQEALYERLASLLVAVAVIAREQPAVLARARCTILSNPWDLAVRPVAAQLFDRPHALPRSRSRPAGRRGVGRSRAAAGFRAAARVSVVRGGPTRPMTKNATGNLTETSLRVLIADEDEAALRQLHRILEELGHEVTPFAVSVRDAVELIVPRGPAPRDRRGPRGRRARARADRRGRRVRRRARDRPAPRRRRGLPLPGGRSWHLRLRGVHRPGLDPGRRSRSRSSATARASSCTTRSSSSRVRLSAAGSSSEPRASSWSATASPTARRSSCCATTRAPAGAG